MNLITSITALAIAFMMIIGLAIPAIKLIDYSHYSGYYFTDYNEYIFNGFNTLAGEDFLDSYAGLVAAVNWILLLLGILCLILAFASIFNANATTARKIEKFIIVSGVITSFLYMLEGIIMSSMMSADEKIVTAPVLFVIQIVLVVIYCICDHVNKNKTAPIKEEKETIVTSKPITTSSQIKNINNETNKDELIKYKQLLDMGVISQEEFEKKKKELLNL